MGTCRIVAMNRSILSVGTNTMTVCHRRVERLTEAGKARLRCLQTDNKLHS